MNVTNPSTLTDEDEAELRKLYDVAEASKDTAVKVDGEWYGIYVVNDALAFMARRRKDAATLALMPPEIVAILNSTNSSTEDILRLKAFMQGEAGVLLIRTHLFATWLRQHKGAVCQLNKNQQGVIIRDTPAPVGNCYGCGCNIPAGMDTCGKTDCHNKWAMDHGNLRRQRSGDEDTAVHRAADARAKDSRE